MGVEKVSTGIAGFDEILHGGIPQGRTTLFMGEAGAGKTVLTLQVLANVTRATGSGAIFVGFEEEATQLASNAASFEWRMAEVLGEKLYVINARPRPDVVLAGNFDLSSLLQALKHKAEETGARLIAFDSIDVVLSMLDDRLAERRELYRIHEWLSEHGFTGILTAKFQETGSRGGNGRTLPVLSNKYVFLEFMADCVVALSHHVEDHVSLRYLRITKYRGSGFAENEFPFTITKKGIEVFKARRHEFEHRHENERISTGLTGLDDMLEGGYYRGANVLITGDPGSGRTSFAGAFVHAACLRQEPALFLALGQSPTDMIQCLGRAGIPLEPHVRSGLLHIYDATPDNDCGELHAWRVQELIEQHGPRCLVIDPLSGATNAGGPLHASRVAERLMTFARSRGITAIYTSLPQQLDAAMAREPLPVATLVDTWIHLTNTIEDGERSRRLTVIKSRGTFASPATHEIVRAPEGISLRKVMVRGHRILTGERRNREEARQRAQIARWQREIELMTAQLLAEKLSMESSDGEHPVGMTGETPLQEIPRPERKTRPLRDPVATGLRRSRNKGDNG